MAVLRGKDKHYLLAEMFPAPQNASIENKKIGFYCNRSSFKLYIKVLYIIKDTKVARARDKLMQFIHGVVKSRIFGYKNLTPQRILSVLAFFLYLNYLPSIQFRYYSE